MTPTDAPTHTAAIALGSNLGDRAETISRACAVLTAHPAVTAFTGSDLIETEPLLSPTADPTVTQGRYLNGAALLLTTLSPRELMNLLLDTEAQLGRVRRARWDPRTIDLDLLLYDRCIINDPPDLIVPHPAMHDRLFVLEPLAQIAPDMIHPGTQCSIAQLLRACHRKNGQRLQPPQQE